MVIPQSFRDGIQAIFCETLTPEEVMRRILLDVRQRSDDAIFVKIVSVIGLNEKALQAIGPAAEIIARAEGLNGHAESVARRLRSPEVG